MTDLRAPLRYRKAHHTDTTFAWVFGVGLVLLALLGFEYYQAVQIDKAAQEREEAWEQQERQNAILGQQQEELRLRAEELAEIQRQMAIERAGTSGYYSSSYSARPTRPGQSEADRNALEAIAIMQGTRRIQREWDRQQYSDSAPDPIVIGKSKRQEAANCGSLRAERNAIEATMRRGFHNGQGYRDRLTEISKQLFLGHCDQSRF